MSRHSATVIWKNSSPDFAAGRYSRVHEWAFDEGLRVSASAAPSIVPEPYASPAAVDPEEAFVASVSSCHMLWFLDRAREAGFIVEKYVDRAVGFMATGPDGRMAIARIELSPEICWRETTPDAERISRLHEEAHHNCYIANSIRAAVIVKENHPGSIG